MKNERLASIFSSYPFETRVQMSMMEALLGNDKVEKILNDLDSVGVPSEVVIEGRPLRAYSGLTEQQLDQLGLSADGKKQLYEYYEKPTSASKQEQLEQPEESKASEEEVPSSSKDSSVRQKKDE